MNTTKKFFLFSLSLLSPTMVTEKIFAAAAAESSDEYAGIWNDKIRHLDNGVKKQSYGKSNPLPTVLRQLYDKTISPVSDEVKSILRYAAREAQVAYLPVYMSSNPTKIDYQELHMIGSAMAVKALLRHGVPVNLQDNEGKTLLMHALEERIVPHDEKLETVTILLNAHADLDRITDNSGQTARDKILPDEPEVAQLIQEIQQQKVKAEGKGAFNEENLARILAELHGG